MHRFVVHTHEHPHAGSLFGAQKVGMQRHTMRKLATLEVEETPLLVVFKIGKEAYEARQTHHKHQMEVGKVGLGTIEPLHAVHHIVEEQRVLLLATRGIIEEFGYEERNRSLIHIVGNRLPGKGHAHILEVLQAHRRAEIERNVEQRERLEELLLHPPTRRLRYPFDERYTPKLLGKHIDNHLRVAILHRPQHQCASICQHVSFRIGRQKYEKPMVYKNLSHKIWLIEKKLLPLHPLFKATVPSSIG